MSDIFISHVEDDDEVALEIALGLEKAGYTTWCYEADSVPGLSYLIQTGQAVEQAKTVVVVISPHSIVSRQVTKEIVRAHEAGKEFIPVRRNISHIEFQNRQPEWREAFGAASSIEITPAGIEDVVMRIVDGLKALGFDPSKNVEPNRIERLRKILTKLPKHTVTEKAARVEVPVEQPEEKVTTPEVLPVKTPGKTGQRSKRFITAAIVVGIVVVIDIAVVLLRGCFVRYSLDVIVSPAGSGTVVPVAGNYDADTKVTLTATPAQGYAFDRWGGDISSESTSITFIMDEGKNITAYFKVQYKLNTSVSPAGGGTVVPIAGTYDADTKVILTAAPAQGYAFDRWGGDVTGESTSIAVTMDNEKNITAYFKVQYKLNISVSPAGGGTVVPVAGTYDAGTKLTLTATPAQGYAFDRWGGDITGESTSIMIIMDNGKNITAYFSKNIVEDRFDDNRYKWYVDKDNNISNGVYNVKIPIEGDIAVFNKTDYIWPDESPGVANFGFEIDIIPIQVEDAGGRGIVFFCDSRTNVIRKFVFVISGYGNYRLNIEMEGTVTTIVDWKNSQYINKGIATNRLSVICRNSIIELYVNNQLLEKIEGSYPDDVGDNGVGTLVTAKDGAHVTFDNLRMWVITD